ncbi:MAG TPA: hypothetical protein VFZ98_07485 [Vicinamibacterales bacterium]
MRATALASPLTTTDPAEITEASAATAFVPTFLELARCLERLIEQEMQAVGLGFDTWGEWITDAESILSLYNTAIGKAEREFAEWLQRTRTHDPKRDEPRLLIALCGRALRRPGERPMTRAGLVAEPRFLRDANERVVGIEVVAS